MTTHIILARFIKFFWIISLFGFLVILFFCYSLMPDHVVMENNLSQIFNLPKAGFFYWVLGAFVVSNITWFVFSGILGGLSRNIRKTDKLPVFYSSVKLFSYINWVNSFSIICNLFIIMGTLFLTLLNTSSKDISNLIWIPYSGAVLMIVWMFLLVYVFLSKVNPQEEID
jgi:hypothetical protein